MRLHRIRLVHFRGVADREVAFATDGITVVDGPNEVGKSSIPDALDLLLRRHDSSTARDVTSAVPVGLDVGPFVEVELSTGPYRFVYSKRWLRDRATCLDILEPTRRHLTGRDAHDDVERMLAETLDADLWEALRVTQGAAAAPVSVHTASLARVLDAASGAEPGSVGDEALVDRIADERLQYWTQTGRPRGERVALATEVADLDARIAALTGTLTDLEADAHRVDELVALRRELVAARQASQTELALAEQRWAAVELARVHVDDCTRRRDLATSQRSGAESTVHRRRELVDDVLAAEAELDKLRAELDKAAASAERAASLAEQARASRSQAEEQLRVAAAGLVDADGRRARRVNLDHLASLEDRQERAAVAERSVLATQAALAELPGLDRSALARLDAALLALVQADARREGASTRLIATAARPIEVLVDGVVHEVGGSAPSEWLVADRSTLEVAGLVHLTVEPGDGAATLSQEAARRRADLDALCAELAVESVEHARQVVEAREAALRELRNAHDELERALGRGTRADLDASCAELQARLGGIESDVATGQERSLAELEADVADARRAVDAQTAARDDLAADERHHHERAERARLEDQALVGRIEQAGEQHVRLVARLVAARSDADDTTLDDALVLAQEVLLGAEVALDHARSAEAALRPDELRSELTTRQDADTDIEVQLAATGSEIDRLQARLEASGEQGLASELDDAVSRREHLGRRLDQLERRAAAARRLHDTVESHRDAARRRYAAPFRQEVERLGRLVFGPSLDVELDADLGIARRTLDDVALDVDQLSMGAREQLGLLARLACASIVSADGGAPVMFDDVLGHADPDRLVAMGQALEAAADDCQIIILTCTPERYASLDGATRVSLA